MTYRPDMDTNRHTLRVAYQLRGETVADLLAYCQEHDLDIHATKITSGHLHYTRLETEEERDERVKKSRAAAIRHREWVRSRYHAYFTELGGAELCGLITNDIACVYPFMHEGPCSGEAQK